MASTIALRTSSLMSVRVTSMVSMPHQSTGAATMSAWLGPSRRATWSALQVRTRSPSGSSASLMRSARARVVWVPMSRDTAGRGPKTGGVFPGPASSAASVGDVASNVTSPGINPSSRTSWETVSVSVVSGPAPEGSGQPPPSSHPERIDEARRPMMRSVIRMATRLVTQK